MAKYQITIDENHLAALMKATEAFSRICTGQLQYALEEGWQEKLWNLPSDQRKMVEDKLKAVTLLLTQGQFDGSNGSYGIYNPEIDPHAATAFNIKQVLRHLLWKEGDKKGFGVDSSVSICNGEEPITIEKVEE